MVDEITQTGNKNFFKTFKGRFTAVPANAATSSTVMLTCINEVQFMGDYTSDENGLVCTLPEECRPAEPVRMVCASSGYELSGTGSAEIDAPIGVQPIELDVFQKPVVGGMTSTEYDSLTTQRVAINMPTYGKQNVEITVRGVIEVDVLLISPGGTVSGKPGTLYNLRGNSFNISPNWYS